MKKQSILCRSVALLLGMLMLIAPVFTLISCNRHKTPDDDIPDGAISYKLTVKTKGGLAMADTAFVITDAEGKTVVDNKTDGDGKYEAWLYPAKYTVTLKDLKPGYSASSVDMSEAGGETVIIAETSVITSEMPANKSYSVGDVMYDFVFLKNGTEVKLSELLQEKKLVLLNFWATYCSPCKSEFPAIEAAFREYSDTVEIVAMSTYDNANSCDNFKTENGYTFNMVPDNSGLYSNFTGLHSRAIPCTVFIDRYGVITEYVIGGNPDSEVWKEAFAHYVSDDYEQSGTSGSGDDDGKNDEVVIEKPNVDMPASSEIEAVVNGSGFNGTYTASSSEYVWPWILNDDKTAIRPSNYGKHSSSAMINTEITLEANEVFAFDCRYAIEYDTYGTQIYDMLAVYVDGTLMQKVLGKSNGWVTVYAYTPLTAGTHTITIAYVKDSSDGYRDFDEFIEVKNIRTVSVSEMTEAGGSMNVLRFAAYGVADANASTSYINYVSVVFNEEDGFYHVGSKNGPLLLAKLCGSTQWSSTSLVDLANGGYLKINGTDYSNSINKEHTRNYCWLENNSDLGYSVVDAALADLLDLFASSLGDGKNHDWEWLEFCSYFDHYGVGDGIISVKDVRSGIDEKSAFDAVEGKNHAVINRVIVPRGNFFKFVPTKTGVYSFYSLSKLTEDDDASTTVDIDTIAWLYDDNGNVLEEGLDEYKGSHFMIHRTLEAGKTYYIAVGFDPVDDLGEFDFMIEYIGEKYDVFTSCTEHYTTTDDATEIIIDRKYNFHAALGTDGYYHQILGYESDGTPILDYSEHGYVYVDFTGVTVFTSFIGWPGSYCTLEKFINGYKGNVEGQYYELGTFDFTKYNSDDIEYKFGNHQEKMLEYLAKALDANNTEAGYVKADAELVEILTEFTLIYGEAGVADQWLMMCSFYRHV